jgi:ATP-binding cassette subfamily B protein
MSDTPHTKPKPQGNIFALLKSYKLLIAMLIVLTVVSNGLNLVIPKLIANAIDAYGRGTFVLPPTLYVFVGIAVAIFVLTYLQSIVQTFAAERVARDLRTQITANISVQDYATIQKITPAKLLTNLTSDVDGVKQFVSMAISTIISSVFLIIGASVLLLILDWKLALAVLAVLPFIGFMFTTVFKKVRKLFLKTQEAIDWLNKVINESILGSALIRLLNSQTTEYQKFIDANTQAMNISFGILRLFATLIPVITFATNIATLIILSLGGHFVMTGAMTLGSFTAFNSYLALLIFPIAILGFMSNVIAQAQASYGRITEVLTKPVTKTTGDEIAQPRGDISLKHVSIVYGEKSVLKDVSFMAKTGTRTAIIGPTAAGKTQLLYLLTGLIEPATGTVEYAGKKLSAYDPVSLHQQIGFVFQDSIIFNLTLRENIAFSNTVKDVDLDKAIETAELRDFVDALPEKLDTIVSERGASLSGGQKQRIMLARALALNPGVLLLDDFTARVDAPTEKKILANVKRNYPNITIISVTQKISSVEEYDQIILLMEGELLASGTHDQLLASSPEYVQIFESQRSTNLYELHAE